VGTSRKPDSLNPKQAEFVKFYLATSNGKDAAIKAGYSEKTAHVIANQLLNNTLVFAAIQKARNEMGEKLHFTREGQLKKLQNIYDDPAARPGDKVKVIEVQNKMLGLDQPPVEKEDMERKFPVIVIPASEATRLGIAQ
jgi:phage terminase small subunit